MQWDDDTLSLPDSLPSLSQGTQGLSDASQIFSTVEGSEYLEGSLSSDGESFGIPDVMNREGDTVASTSSSLSSLRVFEVAQLEHVRLESFIQDIPFPEQDDPPDGGERAAASLEIDSENEQT